MPHEIALDNLRMTDLPSDASFNTQVIEDALAALEPGGRLLAPGGKCYFNPLAEIAKPFALRGMGHAEGGGTTWKSEANGVLIHIGPGAARSYISGVGFQGLPRDAQNNPVNTSQTLFQIRARVFMDRVRISGMGQRGILWRNGTGSMLQSVEIENCVNNSGEAENEEAPGVLTTIRRFNCTIANCGGHGREVIATGGCSYGVGNLITGCGGYAMVMEKVDRYIERGLYCEHNVGDAYLSPDSKNCRLYFQSWQATAIDYGYGNFAGMEA